MKRKIKKSFPVFLSALLAAGSAAGPASAAEEKNELMSVFH